MSIPILGSTMLPRLCSRSLRLKTVPPLLLLRPVSAGHAAACWMALQEMWRLLSGLPAKETLH
ncbi:MULTISPECIES: hypothetical protein [Sphingobium]|uniref:Uncharacterized protein n=1 Tax=Sphingobium yanoikuyae TaxID=13690 RepID=A0A6M4GG72_SPHYA|nr:MULTISPECIES: hypothetical protein [Sphingobium]QJR06018.1 hypothetical protein HH800_27605 [Sphingobium yanoikuyae]